MEKDLTFSTFYATIIIYIIQILKERKVITKMGALAKVRDNLKESKVGLMLGDVYRLLLDMFNSVENNDMDQTVEQAIKETIKDSGQNPMVSKELEKFMPINEISQKVLEEQASERFDTSQTFGKELKDKDGYNKIPDTVTEKAQVSEKEAIEKSAKPREKGGEQKEIGG